MLLLSSWLQDEPLEAELKGQPLFPGCRSPGKAIPAVEKVLEICWRSWSPSPVRENKPCLSGPVLGWETLEEIWSCSCHLAGAQAASSKLPWKITALDDDFVLGKSSFW